VVVDAGDFYGLHLPLEDMHVIVTLHSGELSKIGGMAGRVEVPAEANTEERMDFVNNLVVY
jgi:hypothetical protein